MIHEWHLESFRPKGILFGNFHCKPDALTSRLRELEDEGYEIFGVNFTQNCTEAWILYRLEGR